MVVVVGGLPRRRLRVVLRRRLVGLGRLLLALVLVVRVLVVRSLRPVFRGRGVVGCLLVVWVASVE